MNPSKSLIVQKKNDASLIQHITLVIGLVCVGIGQTLLYTILGPASREIGLSEFSVGLIVTIAALIIVLSSGAWGRLIAKFGSKKSYISGMTFYTLGSLSLAYALNLGIQHSISTIQAFIILLTIRGITGALTAGIHPAAMTYIAESTSKENRGAGIALIASAYGIGSVIGPLLGSVVGSYSLTLPIYLAATISLLGTVFGVFILKPQENSIAETNKSNKKIKLSDKRVFPILIGIAFTYVGFSAFQQTISFYIQDSFSLYPQETIVKTGVAVSIMALLMIATQLIYIQIFKPQSKKLLFLGLLFCVFGFCMLGVLNSKIFYIYVGSGSLGVGFGMMIPAIQASASLAVNEEEQSGVAGFLFGASAFGYVIGPVLGTYLYSLAPEIMFSTCVFVVIIAAVSTKKIIGNK
ncbi:MFS transporter [Pantoea ananatis]|uniref:MFS transporter n=1 Tax=Pantoea ananas TaxID=553 RepID=UPI0007630580|nr:MFS transporter [Pantoea ananatis]AMB74505.1 hypothetical protein AW734_07130 [Pantoea ananatis]ASN16658.1 MFS transporter [Pantoea ananatis]